MKRFLLGFFMLCLGFNLFAQVPANDNCADAVAVTLDEVVDFTTLNATTDGAKHLDCLGVNDSIEADVWYTWTATATGAFRWSNCGTADFDSRVAVYENAAGCPPTDAELVACNDDGPIACSGTFFTSEVNFLATMGNDYTFRMGGFDANPDSIPAMGTGTVTLTMLNGPANDFCAAATSIDLGESQAFSTVNAITDGPNHPGNAGCFGFNFETMESDIWFNYTAGFTGAVQWNTCGTITFDSRLAVYNPGSPCPPADGDLYDCNDDSGCPDYHSTLIFDVAQGETYLMRLGGFAGNSGTGNFDLIEIIPPTPPANDECVDAAEAFVISEELADNVNSAHGLFFGTTVNGSQESDFEFPPCLGNMNGGEFSDVWYKFNTLSNDTIEVRFNPVTPESVFIIDFYDACGVQADSTLTGVCFDNLAGVPVRDTLFTLPAADTDMLMRVTTRLTSETSGDFIFQLVGKNFIASGTNDLKEVNAFEINPNPVSNSASVEFNLTDTKRLSFSIVNNMGQVIQQESVKQYLAGRHVQQIDMSNIPAGVYFIALNDGANTKVQKVVKL